MKNVERIFVVIALIVDLFLLKFSSFFAQALIVLLMYKFPFSFLGTSLKTFFPAITQNPVAFGVELIFVIVFYLLLFYFFGLYRMNVTRSIFTEFRKLFLVVTLSTLLMFLVVSFLTATKIDPLHYIFTVVLSFIILAIWRYILRGIQRFLAKRFNVGVHYLVLIDDQEKNIASVFERDMKKAKWFGYRLSKVLTSVEMGELEQLHQNKKLDALMHVAPNAPQEDTRALMDFCDERKIRYQYIPNLLQSRRMKVDTFSLAGYPIVSVHVPHISLYRSRFFKRVFDILASIVFMVVSIPIYLVVAILVKATSQGPIFFKHKRVGRKRKHFRYYQFRSMKLEFCTSDQNPNREKALEYERELIKTRDSRKGPLYKIKDDPRLTSIGGFLRRFSIDEWPSALSVFLGKMSWVGPRPHQVREVKNYPEGSGRLFDVKPGITGLSQISGRSDLSFEEEKRSELHYIENWSFWGDIVILLKTPKALLSKRKAD